MSTTDGAPKSLIEAVRFFADPDNCRAFMVAMRWPDGVRCPRCDSDEVTYLAKARVWKCRGKHDAQKFSAKVGTVMEDSPIGLDKWLPAIWLLVNCKNGVSSYEVHRALGVTQKTAWFMLHRIRAAMQTSGGKLGGPGKTIEVDESWIGGRARSMNKKQLKKMGTSAKMGPYAYRGKAIVMGILERGGHVRTKVVSDVSKASLIPPVKEHVEFGSAVHTDTHFAYLSLAAPITAMSPEAGAIPEERLGEPMYDHASVNHAAEEYVRGNVHTNGIENFWSLLKRGIRGTYVSVEPFHLFRYLDEQAFRFNERRMSDGRRFIEVCRALVGKRLTYKNLIGASAAAGV